MRKLSLVPFYRWKWSLLEVATRKVKNLDVHLSLSSPIFQVLLQWVSTLAAYQEHLETLKKKSFVFICYIYRYLFYEIQITDRHRFCTFLFCFGCAHSIKKCPCQSLNSCHSSNQSHSSDNTGYLSTEPAGNSHVGTLKNTHRSSHCGSAG